MASYKQLAEFYAKAPTETRPRLQFHVHKDSSWEDCPVGDCPDTSHHIEDWRWKPTKKPVDMSVLINSDIDCVFGDREIGYLSKERRYQDCTDFHSAKGDIWIECKPRMNHWFMTENLTRCPHRLVSELWEAGFTVTKERFTSKPGRDHVIFCITGLKAGYDWPWLIEE